MICIGCGVDHSPDTGCPDGTTWWSGVCECRICTYRAVWVVPFPQGNTVQVRDLLCPNCENRSVDAVDLPEEL